MGLRVAVAEVYSLRERETYLIKMASDTVLPIFAEICRMILAWVQFVALGVVLRLFGICWLCLIVYSCN